MFSGEVMPLKHLKQWQDALPEAMFVNLYGPTEVTCNCTYHIVDPLRDYEKGIPIGHPFMNEAVFLLAADGTQITQQRIKLVKSWSGDVAWHWGIITKQKKRRSILSKTRYVRNIRSGSI